LAFNRKRIVSFGGEGIQIFCNNTMRGVMFVFYFLIIIYIHFFFLHVHTKEGGGGGKERRIRTSDLQFMKHGLQPIELPL
jgi:hypothetical protein